MKLLIYPRVSEASRKCMKRQKGAYGRLYTYRPRRNLILRLCSELGMTQEQVIIQIQKESAYVKSNYVVVEN